MRKFLLWIVASGFALTSTPTFAISEFLFHRLIGFKVVDVKTIVGYQDEDGSSGEDFKGCQYNRIILFEDNKILTCIAYSYTYSYRPDAVLFTNGSSWKMLVDGEIFDMRLR
jgi:hypothetical protein